MRKNMIKEIIFRIMPNRKINFVHAFKIIPVYLLLFYPAMPRFIVVAVRCALLAAFALLWRRRGQQQQQQPQQQQQQQPQQQQQQHQPQPRIAVGRGAVRR